MSLQRGAQSSPAPQPTPLNDRRSGSGFFIWGWARTGCGQGQARAACSRGEWDPSLGAGALSTERSGKLASGIAENARSEPRSVHRTLSCAGDQPSASTLALPMGARLSWPVTLSPYFSLLYPATSNARILAVSAS